MKFLKVQRRSPVQELAQDGKGGTVAHVHAKKGG
jgi:hypothetical protein